MHNILAGFSHKLLDLFLKTGGNWNPVFSPFVYGLYILLQGAVFDCQINMHNFLYLWRKIVNRLFCTHNACAFFLTVIFCNSCFCYRSCNIFCKMITFAEEVMCLSRFAGLFVCEHSYSKSCGWIFLWNYWKRQLLQQIAVDWILSVIWHCMTWGGDIKLLCHRLLYVDSHDG